MQFKIYVPAEKGDILRRLNEMSRHTGRSKSSLALAALEAYLAEERPALETFHLGAVEIPQRDDLYSKLGKVRTQRD